MSAPAAPSGAAAAPASSVAPAGTSFASTSSSSTAAAAGDEVPRVGVTLKAIEGFASLGDASFTSQLDVVDAGSASASAASTISSPRADALLSGLVPVPAAGPLAAAFRAGVAAAQRAAGRGGAGAAPHALDEVSPRELGALLAPGCADARLRALAARALLHLAAAARDAAAAPAARDEARTAFVAALEGGAALRGMLAAAAACAAACEARATAEGAAAAAESAAPLLEAALPEVLVLAHAFAPRLLDLKEDEVLEKQVATKLFPEVHGLSSEDLYQAADAAAAFVRFSFAVPRHAADAVVLRTTRLLCVVNYRVYYFCGGAAHEAVALRFALLPATLGACFKLLARYPQTQLAEDVVNVLNNGANFSSFVSVFLTPESHGAPGTLAEISSTMHSVATLQGLLSVVSNACGQSGATGLAASRAFAEHDVFELLQPALLSSNKVVGLTAAFSVVTLARREELAPFLDKTDVLVVMLDVLRGISFGEAHLRTAWMREDAENMTALLSASTRPVLQLACLHALASTLSIEGNKDFVVSLLVSLRVAASSGDAFVYSGAAFVLSRLGEAVPAYREHKSAAAEALEPAALWSIDAVCGWAAKQPFRVYKTAFKENFVSGEMLLSLTEEDLAGTLGVTNALHRRAIMFAIRSLSGEGPGRGAALARSPSLSEIRSEGPSGTGAGASPAPALPLSPSRASSTFSTPHAAAELEAYDVFISYRRQGGADFAQLVKLLLRAEGLNVFLDVENLATGNFADQLVSCLRRSKNVVLVWTKGCMDRFLDGADERGGDFVRLEYAHALQMRANIVPLYKEDFVFPAPARLPADVRDVLGLNAVKFVSEYREASVRKLLDALR